MNCLIDYKEEENINVNISQLKDDSIYEMKKDSLSEALKATKSKFIDFCKINYNKKNSNIMENIKNKNIHTQYIFKKKNLNKLDGIINDEDTIEELCKNIRNKKCNKSIDNNLEKTKDTDNKNLKDLDNKTDKNDYFDIAMNNYSIIDTKTSDNEKIENIGEFIQIKNNNNNNQDLFNQNTNLNLLCKKRNNDCSYIKEDANNLLNEIQNLYNNYNKGKKDQQSGEYKFYEEIIGFYSKNLTIIENSAVICIVYIEKKVIAEIYLIKEKIFVKDKDDIIDILSKIKQNIQNKLK